MTVLLADDSATTRSLQRAHLASLGVTDVVEVADGRAAWVAFRQRSFDLVLADGEMPVLDGYGLLRAIRTVDTTIPVVLVVTESERSRVVSAVRNGANGYLVKPVSREALAEKFESWVTVDA